MCSGLSLQSSQYVVPEDVRAAGFQIDADELTSIVESRDTERLTEHGQLDGIADKLATSLTDGISMREDLLVQREQIYGVNKFAESEPRSFWEFVWDAVVDSLESCNLLYFGGSFPGFFFQTMKENCDILLVRKLVFCHENYMVTLLFVQPGYCKCIRYTS